LAEPAPQTFCHFFGWSRTARGAVLQTGGLREQPICAKELKLEPTAAHFRLELRWLGTTAACARNWYIRVDGRV
jgi:hypothetical protein